MSNDDSKEPVSKEKAVTLKDLLEAINSLNNELQAHKVDMKEQMEQFERTIKGIEKQYERDELILNETRKNLMLQMSGGGTRNLGVGRTTRATSHRQLSRSEDRADEPLS